MINLDEEKLDTIKRGFHLPPKPDILSELAAELEKEDVDIGDVSDILSRDISLSALLLKTINSPIFGLRRTISDIRQATMFLGLNQLNQIVTVALLKKNFNGKACISLERFWDESLEVAMACAWIGENYKLKVPTDELYTFGLFHNIGISAMALRYPDYVDVLKEVNNSHRCNVTKLERARYQTDHAVIGYYIATSWNLPKDACQVILNHHEVDFLDHCRDDKSRLVYAILKCSESAVVYSRRQQFSPDWELVAEGCLAELGLASQDFEDLVEDFAEHFYDHA